MCVTQQLDVVSTVSIIQQDSTVKDVKMERGEMQHNSNAKHAHVIKQVHTTTYVMTSPDSVNANLTSQG